MTTERQKNERNMVFFKRQLSRIDTYYVLLFNEHAMVTCWEDAEGRWRAGLSGARANGSLVTASGRTPREALRKLEKKTIKAIQTFVSTFAVALREAGVFFKKVTTGK
jgi:hypothetical protein